MIRGYALIRGYTTCFTGTRNVTPLHQQNHFTQQCCLFTLGGGGGRGSCSSFLWDFIIIIYVGFFI